MIRRPHVLGIDDGPFEKGQTGRVPLVAALCEGASLLEAVARAEFPVDGEDATGKTLADGTYRIEIAAVARGAKTPTAVPLVTRGTVDGVDLAADPAALLVGTLRIPLAQVREVHDTASDTGTSP